MKRPVWIYVLVAISVMAAGTFTSASSVYEEQANVNYVSHIGGSATSVECSGSTCISTQGSERVIFNYNGGRVFGVWGQSWIRDILINGSTVYIGHSTGIEVCSFNSTSLTCNSTNRIIFPPEFFEGDFSYFSDMIGVGTGSSFRIFAAGGENGTWMINPANKSVVKIQSGGHIYKLGKVGNYIVGTDNTWGLYCGQAQSYIAEDDSIKRDYLREFWQNVEPEKIRPQLRNLQLASPQAAQLHTGLDFINVSNPTAPQYVGKKQSSGATHATLVGPYMFEVNQNEGLIYLFDHDNPLNSPLVSNFSNGCGYYHVEVTPDQTKVIASGFDTIALDVSNIATDIRNLRFIDVVSGIGGELAVTNDRVRVAVGDKGLYHMSLSNTSMDVIQAPELSGPAVAGVRVGQSLITAQGCEGLWKIDATQNPPRVVASNRTIAECLTHLTVSGNRLYASASNRVVTADSNMQDIVKVTLPDFRAGYDLRVAQGKLYLASQCNGYIVMGLSNPRVPAFERAIGQLCVDDWTLNDLNLYAADINNDIIHCFSMSNPNNPPKVGEAYADAHQIGVFEGSVLAAITNQTYVDVFRRHTNGCLIRYSPNTIIDTTAEAFAFAISQNGEFLGIGTKIGSEVWRRISAANVTPPTFVKWGENTTVKADHVVFVGGFLFQMSGPNGIVVLSVSQPTSPTATTPAPSTATRTSAPPTATRTAIPPTQIPGLNRKVWVPLILNNR